MGPYFSQGNLRVSEYDSISNTSLRLTIPLGITPPAHRNLHHLIFASGHLNSSYQPRRCLNKQKLTINFRCEPCSIVKNHIYYNVL